MQTVHPQTSEVHEPDPHSKGPGPSPWRKRCTPCLSFLQTFEVSPRFKIHDHDRNPESSKSSPHRNSDLNRVWCWEGGRFRDNVQRGCHPGGGMNHLWKRCGDWDHQHPFRPNYLYIETSHLTVHKAWQNLCQISILNTFLKSQICTQTLTPAKNHIKFLKIKNQMLPFKHPYKKLHSIHFFHQIFILSKTGPICLSMSQIFHPFTFQLFNLKNMKIQTAYYPSSYIIYNTN